MTAPSPLPEIQSRAFRSACARFPCGVTIVTRCGQGMLHSGLTVSSFTSVSLDPPLVLVSIRSTSPFLDGLDDSAFYAINVLSESHAAISTRFAQPDKDRFECGHWTSGKTGSPILCDAVAVLECALAGKISAGDHVLLLGRVVDCVERDGEALVHYRSRYHRLWTGYQPAGTLTA